MSRFVATPDTILSHLSSTMGKMHPDARLWTVNCGARISRALAQEFIKIGCAVDMNTPALYPLGAAIGFERKAIPYAFHCVKYDRTLDNLRAVQQAVSWSWRIYEDYGVTSGGDAGEESFARIFGGHRADTLALPPSWTHWWEVLGVPRDAPMLDIERAYLRQIRVVHPDNQASGNEYLTRALNAAYDAARRERGA